MKKTVSIGMASILTLSSLFTASSGALAESDSLVKDQGFNIVKDAEDHKIIIFENNDKLEMIENNGEVYSYVETEGKNLKVFKEDDKVFIVDRDTNKTVQTIAIEIEEEPALQSPSNSLGLNSIEKMSVGTNAVVPTPVGDSSLYRYSHTAKLSVELGGFGLAVGVSVVAAAMGLSKGNSVLSGIVAGALALALPKLYWKRHVYKYSKGIYRYERHVNQFYKYHDYTGYLGVHYTYLQGRIGVS